MDEWRNHIDLEVGGSPPRRRSSHEEANANRDREPPSTQNWPGAKRGERNPRDDPQTLGRTAAASLFPPPSPWNARQLAASSDRIWLTRPMLTPTVFATTLVAWPSRN
jgi:hypothetical protein